MSVSDKRMEKENVIKQFSVDSIEHDIKMVNVIVNFIRQHRIQNWRDTFPSAQSFSISAASK